MPASPTAIENKEPAQEVLLVRREENGVAIVQLHRPEATNALSLELQAALSQTFQQLGTDASVRCIVLTGAGERAFCAGGDLKERRGMTDEAWQRTITVLCLLSGPEALVVLRDVSRIDEAAGRDVVRWAAETVLDATFR